MSFEFDEDLLIGDLPVMASSDIGQWLDIAFKLKTTRVAVEEKPWSDEAKVHYVVLNIGDDAGWHESEIPFWTAKLWLDFAGEFGDKKGNLKCKYRRVEEWNDKAKRMDNKGEFEIEDPE